jgi:hypothetical protein
MLFCHSTLGSGRDNTSIREGLLIFLSKNFEIISKQSAYHHPAVCMVTVSCNKPSKRMKYKYEISLHDPPTCVELNTGQFL